VLDRDDTPIEYAITRFRADRIQLRITPCPSHQPTLQEYSQ
jgi:hypothetical protein